MEDAVEGIVLAVERYESSNPVNLGSACEISIKDLVGMITQVTGFRGRVILDTTKPNGQPRSCLDTSRAEREFGFRATVPLLGGLERTVA